MEIWQHEEDPAETASAMCMLATMYESSDEFDKAESFYERAIEIHGELDDDDELISMLSDFAEFYESKQRYADAERTYQRAIALDEANVSVLSSLAACYQAQKKYDDAELIYQRTYDIYEEESDHEGRADSLESLASIYEAQSKYTDAERLYKQVLEIRNRRNSFSLPFTLISLASLYSKLREHRNAISFSKRAIAIAEERFPKNELMVDILRPAVEVYRAAGDEKEALFIEKRISRLQEENPTLPANEVLSAQTLILHQQLHVR